MRFYYYIVMNALAIRLEFLLIFYANRSMAMVPITLLREFSTALRENVCMLQ